VRSAYLHGAFEEKALGQKAARGEEEADVPEVACDRVCNTGELHFHGYAGGHAGGGHVGSERRGVHLSDGRGGERHAVERREESCPVGPEGTAQDLLDRTSIACEDVRGVWQTSICQSGM
jgi:hypothetical protein